QGFWLVRSRVWETVALLLVAFTLFRPGFWWDMIYPPLKTVEATKLETIAEQIRPDGFLRLATEGETIEGEHVAKTVMLRVGAPASGAERLAQAGIEVKIEDNKVLIDNLVFGSAAEKAGLDFDWEIKGVQIETERPRKEWMFIPALALLGIVGFLQRTRRDKAASSSAAS
ncbi:MAG: DUF3394 domain-containing protein, partial [Acidiferrobacterales bacterium]|nr:DUF3394 domain-containing protein [Acidiferrobacterales bacterium]